MFGSTQLSGAHILHDCSVRDNDLIRQVKIADIDCSQSAASSAAEHCEQSAAAGEQVETCATKELEESMCTPPMTPTSPMTDAQVDDLNDTHDDLVFSMSNSKLGDLLQ